MLLKIFEDDDLGLLNVKPKVTSIVTADDRLVESFESINKFIDENSREPELSNTDMQERKLYTNLKAIREDKTKSTCLVNFDRYNLLQKEVKIIKTMEDVFEDDDLGLLDNEALEIFNLKHIPKERIMPDYVAKRVPCKNFDNFEELFKNCQNDLREGKRVLSPFKNEQSIEKSKFFVLRGILLFVEEIGDFTETDSIYNPRLRCIFENGTESDLLLRSLAAALYLDGRTVSQNMNNSLDKLAGIVEEDKESGFIYILKSLNSDEKVQSIANLYKIGFSTTPVEQRIRNAEQEPTYLMAPVKIVAEYKTFNMNTQKFELLLHNFLGSCCVSIDIFDQNGVRHTPREWFSAPYEIIDDAIKLIVSGEVVNYKYDREKKEIVIKS